MRTKLTLFVFVLFLALFPSIAWAELNVVATLSSLGDLAKAIGGEHVNVQVLVKANEDPHYVDARPDYILKLNKADVLIYNGMELEIGWLPALQKNARNSKIISGSSNAIDASQFIKALEVPSGKVERSAGDIHPQGNPHYLYAANNAILVAQGIKNRLVQLDPERARHYEENTKRLLIELENFSNKQVERFQTLPLEKKQFISYHASLVYVADWLGLESVASIEPKPGLSPNPAHVAKIISLMREKGIKTIIQESYQARSTSDKIAKMTNASIVVINNGPQTKGEETYIAYLQRFCDELYTSLNKH